MLEPFSTAELATAEIELMVPLPAVQELITPARIRSILARPRELLSHGASYTGRPATGIYRDAEYVVKLRTEYRFNVRDARRWVVRARDQEQRLGVYHPGKRWFLIHSEKISLIGNITPMMTPLHLLGDKGFSADDQCAYLERMLERYLCTEVEHGLRLDEGLSNFALAADGTLYYVDDDTYRWDGFISLSQAIGYWCRALPWFSVSYAQRIGAVMRELLRRYHKDGHTGEVVANLISRLHMANAEQQQRRDALLKGLQQVEGNGGKPPQRDLSFKKPIAILADIHANYPALQAVMAEMDRQGVDQALVLGDIVGYGPHPRECIRALRARDFVVIKGNHDYAVAEGQYKWGFSSHARTVAEWTRGILDDEELAWLNALPPFVSQDGYLAVHGAPQDNNFFFGYVYHMTYESNLDNLAARAIEVCFHGHSHHSGVYFRSKKGLSHFSKDTHQRLGEYSHSLVCPGSVGQPRDNTGSAARFAVFQPQDKQLTYCCVDYDVEATANDIRANGLPEVLAQRLQKGV